jgi:hypothetical protein
MERKRNGIGEGLSVRSLSSLIFPIRLRCTTPGGPLSSPASGRRLYIFISVTVHLTRRKGLLLLQ